MLTLAALSSGLVHFLFLSWVPPRLPPAPIAADPPSVIEITMPPVEEEVYEAVEALGDGTDEPGLAPPQLADVPSVQVTAFMQPLQPPPPPGMSVGKGLGTIPVGRFGSGLGKGMANLFDVKNLDQAPVPRATVPPDYPYEMRRQAVAGTVDLEYIIDAEGSVVAVAVLGSSHPEFEPAAVSAVRKWKYRPGRKGGRAVNTRVQQTLRFNLEKD